ncbi:MAG: histidine kinase dimerization/phospho-acceptor domain-containing protein, partial [Reyranella sp.]|nr:histidine kinase dimerization/phospho-acceptor domain-containing protein [Reyranella sp.]
MIDRLADDVAAISSLDVVPKILDVVCRTTGLGFAAVARVTEDRWVTCAVRDEIAFGLTPGDELDVTTTLCNEIRQHGAAVVIDHVAEDDVYRDHATPKRYGFQSYISTPIYCRGEFFGTLCAIDPRPARMKEREVLATLELFAELIGGHLDVQARLERSEAALLSEREAAELREQFIAVLGHDLRNPLAAIDGGARMLLKAPLDARAVSIVGQMRASVDRMVGLIDNILDFARGRLGGGLAVETLPDAALGATLEQVLAEFRTAQPNRSIATDIVLAGPVT